MSVLSFCWTTFDLQSFGFAGIYNGTLPGLFETYRTIYFFPRKNEKRPYLSFLLFPLLGIKNKPFRYADTVGTACLSRRETGLQFNPEQQAEVLPLDHKHMTQFLHCGRNLWLLSGTVFTVSFYIISSLFSFSFHFTIYIHITPFAAAIRYVYWWKTLDVDERRETVDFYKSWNTHY